MLCYYYYFFLYMYVDMINDGNTYVQINLFSPWYSWIIAEFTIKKQSPTHTYGQPIAYLYHVSWN